MIYLQWFNPKTKPTILQLYLLFLQLSKTKKDGPEE